MGLSQLTVQTSGKITVASDARRSTDAGGAFEATAGRSLTVDGAIIAPSGSIDLTTADFIENSGLGGSVLVPDAAGPGSFDITINGESERGRPLGQRLQRRRRPAGGFGLSQRRRDHPVRPRPGSRRWTPPFRQRSDAPTQSVDISGSILINSGGVLNVTGGGYVSPTGAFSLTATGGNVSLFDETAYFQFANDNARFRPPGGLPGFRVTTIQAARRPGGVVSVNPLGDQRPCLDRRRLDPGPRLWWRWDLHPDHAAVRLRRSVTRRNGTPRCRWISSPRPASRPTISHPTKPT